MPLAILLIVVAAFCFYLYTQWQPRQLPNLPAPVSEFERDIDPADFGDMVLANSARVPVVVDFYARWCGPCHRFAPVLAEVAKEFNGAFLLARVDYDRSPELIRQYGIQCVPTIKLFRQGESVDGFEGGQLAHQLRYFLAKNGIKPA